MPSAIVWSAIKNIKFQSSMSKATYATKCWLAMPLLQHTSISILIVLDQSQIAQCKHQFILARPDSYAKTLHVAWCKFQLAVMLDRTVLKVALRSSEGSGGWESQPTIGGAESFWASLAGSWPQIWKSRHELAYLSIT